MTRGRAGSDCSEGGRPRIVRFRKSCSDCVLGTLIKRSAVIAPPVLVDNGRRVRFIAIFNKAVRTLLKSEKLAGVEIIDVRSVTLTSKQRLALKIVADVSTTSRVATELKVSRQAARKLLSRLMKKLAILMS